MRGVVLGLRLPEHRRRPLTRAGACRVSPVARGEAGTPMRPAAFLVAIATWTMVVVSAGCSGVDHGRTPTATVTAHVLRVQGNGAGSGTITAPDASPQLACSISSGALSGVCSNAYPYNTAVRMVATPNGGSTFSGWSGACTGTGDCVVDMSQERVVTAAFAPLVPPVTRSRRPPPGG